VSAPTQQFQWQLRFEDGYAPDGAPIKEMVMELPAATVKLPMNSAQLQTMARAFQDAGEANAKRLHRALGNGPAQ